MAQKKTKLPSTRDAMLEWIDRDHDSMSVRRQRELLGIHRSRLHNELVPETAENLLLMRLIDEQYLRTPFWGSRNMTNFPRRQGREMNCKRTLRLMGKRDLDGMAPRPSTSRTSPRHRVYRY